MFHSPKCPLPCSSLPRLGVKAKTLGFAAPPKRTKKKSVSAQRKKKANGLTKEKKQALEELLGVPHTQKKHLEKSKTESTTCIFYCRIRFIPIVTKWAGIQPRMEAALSSESLQRKIKDKGLNNRFSSL